MQGRWLAGIFMVLLVLMLLMAGCSGTDSSSREVSDGSDIINSGLGNGKETGSGVIPGGKNPKEGEIDPLDPAPDDNATPVSPAPQRPGVVGFASEELMVNEGDGVVQLTIVRTDGSDGEIAVEWGTQAQTAVAEEDYVGVPWTPLTFAAGETSKVVSVTIINDDLVEGDETFQVILRNPIGGATLGVSMANVLIVDNDGRQNPGVMAFSSTNYTLNEGDGAVYITILRTDGSDGPVSVEWGTFGQTATSGEDYVGVSWTPVTFAAGETSKVVSVLIIDDQLVEDDETFQVVLRDPTGGATLGLTTATVLIVDNDILQAIPGTLGFSANNYQVNEGGGTAKISIVRTGGSDGAVSVEWGTQGQTATAGEDYVGVPWTAVTFAAGETSKTVSVTIIDDTLVEGDETFQVVLRNATGGATLGTAAATVQIIDNDTAAAPAPAPDPAPAPPANKLSYLPVFPGAQGFGTETRAGRGGKIIKVTNHNDSGAGSLRAAIEASGARIVVFEVGGVIPLSKDLVIRNPFITIAGQTAPPPGIQVRGAGLTIVTNNVLVQHIGIRVGDATSGPAPDNRDAIQIMGAPHYDTYNVVLDHISASWAIDENASTWYAVRDVTISNSIISEGLHNSRHSKGPHSMGMLIGLGSKRIAMVGNLLAHNNERMPRIQGNLSAVVMNNIFYNVGNSTFSSIGSADGPTLLSMVGNTFINGPNTPSNSRALEFRSELVSGSKIYYPDNRASGTLMLNSAKFNPTVTSAPIWHESFSPKAGSTTEAWVLTNVGTRPANRDAVDRRVVDEVKTRKGRIIDSPSQVGGYPTLAATTRAFNIPTNPNGDDSGNGYTNIEEILFQMAAQVEGR